MVVSWKIVRLSLKETFSIAYGNYTFRDALIITLEKGNHEGHGECTSIDYYHIRLSDFEQRLHEIKSAIEKQTVVHPVEFYQFLLTLELPSFLRSALDCAYWDLFGKLENKSFLELNAITVNTLPESSITISVDAVENQLKKMEQSKWKAFKVKCNQYDPVTIEKLLKSGYKIALDSNGSFSQEDCERLQNDESVAGFYYLEQPMKPGIENYQILQVGKFANWMADEDCQNETNLLSLNKHYKSINIKLVKCGGLTPALQLIRKARQLNFQIMIGCMTESTIGISAGAVLAPLVDYADLDGANLIANDIANGSSIVNGKIELSEKPGLGIELI